MLRGTGRRLLHDLLRALAILPRVQRWLHRGAFAQSLHEPVSSKNLSGREQASLRKVK